MIWWAGPDAILEGRGWCKAWLLYFVEGGAAALSLTDDLLELDSLDLSDPEDFEEALREGCEPRLSVGVAELRPSAAAASALRAELK